MTDASKDHWSSKAYSSAASFVPLLTSKVVTYLAASSGDNILDIGCGDGPLTAQIASSISPTGRIHGLDASPSMISTAESTHSSDTCTFAVQDCRNLSSLSPDTYDKVFSNAALHWILRDPTTRHGVFRDAYRSLKPGGRFVFEMGGKGNIAEIHATVTAAMVKHGVPINKAREASPWFFPSDEWMRQALSDVGFHVEVCELEYRPTKLNANNNDGSGGLEGWVRLMCAPFFEAVDSQTKEVVIKDVCESLETVITREEDGSQWIGYVRLRAVAVKR